MAAVEMVLCGQVNKAVVASFAAHGARAAGISGRDGNLLRAVVKNPALGLVGEVEAVDPALILCLLEGDFVPVVAPVANGPDGQALNINADTAAGALAGALAAALGLASVSSAPAALAGRPAFLAGAAAFLVLSSSTSSGAAVLRAADLAAGLAAALAGADLAAGFWLVGINAPQRL